MTCPVLCICSSIIFLGLVSVISRSSVGDSVGTLVPFFIACSFFAPKGNNPPFHLVSFFQNLFQKKTQPSVSLALFRVHFYICLTFLLSPFDLLKWLILRFYALCKPKNIHFYAVWHQKNLTFSCIFHFFVVPLQRSLNLIISLFCPTFMQVITCSEFLLVPFLTSWE